MKLEIDQDGLFYLRKENLKLTPIHFREFYHKDGKLLEQKSRHDFYLVDGLNNYILKVSRVLTNLEEERYMLKKLQELRGIISDIDFPMGYVTYNNMIIGTIIPYYKASLSFQRISMNRSLRQLSNFMKLDDDPVHNLFLIYREILRLITEMYDNNLAYLDSHGGNFVFWNNRIKVIDFQHEYLRFCQNDVVLKNVLVNCMKMINIINWEYHLPLISGKVSDFSKMEKKLIKLENMSQHVYKARNLFGKY